MNDTPDPPEDGLALHRQHVDRSLDQPVHAHLSPPGVVLTAESRANLDRAPDGTRFYCMIAPGGAVHCAASAASTELQPEQWSRIEGRALPPITVDFAGTGHQQVADRARIAFDKETARIGFVEGEGLGLSIERVSPDTRRYTFRSSFNAKVDPEGGKSMPSDLAADIRGSIEASLSTKQSRSIHGKQSNN